MDEPKGDVERMAKGYGSATTEPDFAPPDIDAINEGDVEERNRVLEQRAAAAEAKASRRSFPRLRLNVTTVSPGYVTCSLFQSDNGGVNWACVGSGVTFPEEWFADTFGANGPHPEGRRIEFTLSNPTTVTD